MISLEQINSKEQYHLIVDGVVKTDEVFSKPFLFDEEDFEKFEYYILEKVDQNTNIEYQSIINNKGEIIYQCEGRFHRIFREPNSDLFYINGQVFIPKLNKILGNAKILTTRKQWVVKVSYSIDDKVKGTYFIDKDTLSYYFEHYSNKVYDTKFTYRG